MDYVKSVLEGERLALSRLITWVENDTPEGRAALDALFPHTGNAHLIGVTGAPGSGKSSLVNRLTHYFRNPSQGNKQKSVAIIAVDPTSPFTGGALLGDRVRMRDLAGDTGIFIRSMASRGALGGLARTTAAVSQVLDAAGYDLILIETVGAGQSEVDIARLAQTTIVIEAPGLGDDIQAIKAGILEIADILVVNKSDHSGAPATVRALRSMLDMAAPLSYAGHHGFTNAPLQEEGDTTGEPHDSWQTPVLMTNAIEAEGIQELAEKVLEHRDFLKNSGLWRVRERERLSNELDLFLQAELVARWRAMVGRNAVQDCLDLLSRRELSPHQAVEKLLAEAGIEPESPGGLLVSSEKPLQGGEK